MELRYEQTNIKHSRAAQDSFWEFMKAEDIVVELVS